MKKLVFVWSVLLFGIKVNEQQIASWKITDVVNFYSKESDSVYVINFWATYCKPCLEEMPFIQSVSKKYADKKVKLLLVSLDLADFYPAKIASFVKRQNINAQTVWLNETDADYFCNVVDKKWQGSIPATVIINSKKKYQKFFEKELTESEFEEALKAAIGK